MKHLLNGIKKKINVLLGFTVVEVMLVHKEKITVSGEVLNFLSTGIDTRVYFIKNF